MTKSKNLPYSALRVSSYAELARYAEAFAAGHLNLLILCGGPGLGNNNIGFRLAFRLHFLM